MNARQQKIDLLRTKLLQLEAAEKAAVQRARATATKRARQDDTRRKILVGAYVLQHAEPGALSSLSLGSIGFADWLTRPDDRALFGLASPSDEAAKAAPAALPALPPFQAV